jgi:hypothetical protein
MLLISEEVAMQEILQAHPRKDLESFYPSIYMSFHFRVANYEKYSPKMGGFEAG